MKDTEIIDVKILPISELEFCTREDLMAPFCNNGWCRASDGLTCSKYELCKQTVEDLKFLRELREEREGEKRQALDLL